MPEAGRADVAEIVKSAFERDLSERARYLDQACGLDTDLRAEVESLLSFGARAPRFMDEPAVHLAADFLAENETLQPDERLDQYEICSLIGTGGMGEVYLAQDTALGRKVALKLVKSGLGTANIIRHFHQEERILAGLNHPHIARLYGGGVTPNGLPYFIMEYVEGERLDEYCNSRRLTTHERLNLFRKVCSAVTYAHQNLVIHRDLKPANIRVTAEGEPKLLDFGIAKLIDSESAPTSGQTLTLQAVMTPEYASPEQVAGDSITTASDVYSLGVILYRLLTGLSPYRTKTNRPDEIARAITGQAPERPSTAHSPDSPFTSHNSRSLRGDLDNIILMAMRKEPARRYASVSQFSEDIRRHLDGLPVVARKDTLVYRATKFVARNRVAVAAAALLFLAILSGLSASIWQARVAARERDQARLKTAQAEELNNFLQGILSAASPEGKGKDATVIEVLNDAAKQIETEFATQPELRARALTTIGRTYAVLGLIDPSERALREAVRLNTMLFGEKNAATALSTIYLGNILLSVPPYREAGTFILKALATERALSPSGSKELAFALYNAGEYHNRMLEYSEARAALQESVEMSQRLFGEANPDYAFALMSLGRACQFSSDFIPAEAHYRKAIAIFRGLPKRYELKMGVALSNLGNLLVLEDRDDEALAVLREAHNLLLQLQGETYFLMTPRMYLCKLHWRKGDYEQAIELGAKAIESARKFHFEGLPDFVYTLEYLGMSLTRTGKAQEAEPLLRESLVRAEKDFPKEDARIAVLEGALGECLAAQERLAEAEPLILHSYEALQKTSGKFSVVTPSGKIDPFQRWRTLAARRTIDLYEKWQKPDLAAKYRTTP